MKYNRIEILLHKKRLLQKDLIEYLGMSRQGLYTMVENQSMKVSTLEKMCEFFDVPINYWFEDESAANMLNESESKYETLKTKETMKQLEKDLEYFRERTIKLEKELEQLKDSCNNESKEAC